MDFELSDEQVLMRSGLRELLDRSCDASRVRAVAYDGDGRDGELWRALADAGWTAVTVPEAEGGAGLRFEDLIGVLEEAGRVVLPLPLTTTLLAARALVRAPADTSRADVLSRIAAGTASVTLALNDTSAGPSGDRPAGCTAERKGESWRLDGSHTFVPYGTLADLMLIEARIGEDGAGLFLVPTAEAGVSWTDLQAVDRTTRQYDCSLAGVVVAGEARVGGSEEIELLLDEWRAALAAETLGACDRMLEMTVAYAKNRTQFGRPIGANQAVKARIAEMGAAVERMRAAVYHAAVQIDAEAEDRGLAIAMAKAATAAPGAFVGSQAIHVHGGIGYTWEHDLHLYFKRVKSNELLLGDATASLARVADAVL